MKIKTLSKHILIALAYMILGTLIVLSTLAVKQLQNRPDLSAWHMVELENQYTADRQDIVTFTDYLALEEELFAELNHNIFVDKADPNWRKLGRFSHGSLSDPNNNDINWNKSFELKPDKPVAKAVLLHGLSDSPYSLRQLALTLHQQNVWVVVIRLPGHGTSPAGLVTATWQDFAAATRLAVQHVTNQHQDLPFYMVGYSNGAALAIEYSLSVLAGEQGVLPNKLLVLSPEIAITPIAKYAVWQSRLGFIMGLEKLDWNSIQFEYDPYKYNSFAVNAGEQSFLITQYIQQQIAKLNLDGKGIQGFPDLLAFQSVVDSTVVNQALVDNLFKQLALGEHELVLFDLNRRAEVEDFLKSDHTEITTVLWDRKPRNFAVSLLSNKDQTSTQLAIFNKTSLSTQIHQTDTELVWPNGIFSLSHLALPIPFNDPLYGGIIEHDEDKLHLGLVELRGESHILSIPQSQLTRLRFNPFYSYFEQKALSFLQLTPIANETP